MATRSNIHGPYQNLFRNYVFNGPLNDKLKAYHSFFFTRMPIKLLFKLYTHCKSCHSKKKKTLHAFLLNRLNWTLQGLLEHIWS